MTALLIALLLAADAPLLVGPDVLLDVPSEKRETSVGQFKSDRQYKVSSGGHIDYYAAPDRNIFPLGHLRENDLFEIVGVVVDALSLAKYYEILPPVSRSEGYRYYVFADFLDDGLKKGIVFEYDPAGEDRRIAAEPDAPGAFLTKKKKFRPDGKLVKESLGRSEYVHEEGIYNGVNYRFYHSDGSGTFGRLEESVRDKIFREAMARSGKHQDIKKDLTGWKTSCKQDAMNDTRYCHARKDDLWVFLYDTGLVHISIGSDHYPGSTTALRFGKETPVVASKDGWLGEKSEPILAKLRSAQTVVTRYRKYSEGNVDKETDLFGFGEVYEYLRFAVTQPLNGSFKKRPVAKQQPKPSPPKPSQKPAKSVGI